MSGNSGIRGRAAFGAEGIPEPKGLSTYPVCADTKQVEAPAKQPAVSGMCPVGAEEEVRVGCNSFSIPLA